MAPVATRSASRVPWWWPALAVAGGLNLLAGLFTFRLDDMRVMHRWTTSWLSHGVDLYASASGVVDYPPNAIVVLAPMALLPLPSAAVVWALLSIVLAVTAPVVAARCIRSDASRDAVVLLTLTFLCWSGTRAVLQFALLSQMCALLAWHQAPRRPWLSGALLGLALMKPQVALPFCIWALVGGRWRVVLASAGTVACLWGVYCVRAGVPPLGVTAGWLAALQRIYTGPEPLTGFSELASLLPLATRDRWSPIIALVLYGLVLLVAVLLRRRNRDDGRADSMMVVPGLAAAATLLAFRHMSLAFVSLLPVSAYLLLDGTAATRGLRRVLFWLLQAVMIFDAPTLYGRLQLADVSLGWLDAVMRHTDRLSIAALFVALLVLQLRAPGRMRSDVDPMEQHAA